MSETTTNETDNDGAIGYTRNGSAFGKGSGFHGKPGRSGPPLGSHNNLRHGLRGSTLPADCKYIQLAVNKLRRHIEDLLLAEHGSIGLVHASHVNSILRWERHALLSQHWLRTQINSLTAMERLKFSAEIARASDCRDKSIKSLGLDKNSSEDVLDALYTRVVSESDSGADLEDK